MPKLHVLHCLCRHAIQVIDWVLLLHAVLMRGSILQSHQQSCEILSSRSQKPYVDDYVIRGVVRVNPHKYTGGCTDLVLVYLRVVARSCCGGGSCNVRVHALQRVLQRCAKGGPSWAEVGLPEQMPAHVYLTSRMFQ